MSCKVTREKSYKFTPLPDPRGDAPKTSKQIAVATQIQDSKPREFVIGDNHFYDPDIINMSPRQFSSVQEMNEYMIKQWNDTVNDNDTVFVLGDFFDFHNCDREEAYEILDQLRGTIILIKGNHDDHLNYFYDYGIQVIEYPILKDEFWIMSHEPMFVTEAAPYANIFAHVHFNPMYNTISSRSFCVSAERHDYKPVLLSEIKKMVRQAALLKSSLRESNNVETVENIDEYTRLEGDDFGPC